MKNERTSILIGAAQRVVNTSDFLTSFTPSAQSFHLTSAQFQFLRSNGFKQSFVVKVSDIVAKKQKAFGSNLDLLAFVNRNIPLIQIYR